MSNIDDFRAFIAIYESTNMTKAANRLNISTSSISKRLSRLEDQLNVRLVERSTRLAKITQVGEDFYHKINPVIREFDECSDWIKHRNETTSGTVKISMPEMLMSTRTYSILSKFSNKYPDVKLSIDISNSIKDPIKNNMDFCFRSGQLNNSQHIALPFLETEHIFCCSEAYLRNNDIPENLTDLINSGRLITPNFLNIQKLGQKLLDRTVDLNVMFNSHQSNSLQAVKMLALSGIGITMLPTCFIEEELKGRRLVQIHKDFKSPSLQINMIYRYRDKLKAPAMLFKDHIKESSLL